MSTFGSPIDMPPAKSEPAVLTATPPGQMSRKNVAFFLLAGLIIAITAAVFLFTYSQSQNTSQSKNPVSQTPAVNMKKEYQNPFDRSQQHFNPFENLK